MKKEEARGILVQMADFLGSNGNGLIPLAFAREALLMVSAIDAGEVLFKEDAWAFTKQDVAHCRPIGYPPRLCRTCRFWKTNDGGETECRRHAPGLHLTTECDTQEPKNLEVGQTIACWPTTADEDSCGDWEQGT